MKNYKYILYLLLSLLVMTGCSKDDDGSSPTSGTRRTIMVYFNAENNLHSAAEADLEELVEGSKILASDCNLLVYFDFIETKDDQNIPAIYKIKNGNREALHVYDKSLDSSDPKVMLSVFQDMIRLSPADEYATVFWGHGDGPIIANSSNGLDVSFEENEPDSYGVDYNNQHDRSKETWIDIPVLANKVMKKLPKQEFIFFDACCMQSIEVAYELRNCTKYLIGATCETPSFGASYSTTTKYFGYTNLESACKLIVDDYQSQSNWTVWHQYFINNVCMSVIKTEDTQYIEKLLEITRENLKELYDTKPLELVTTFSEDEHQATSCIYYWKVSGSRSGSPILYDMNDVMLHNLSDPEYENWKEALDKVVIYRPNTGDIRDTGNCDWYGGDLKDRYGNYYMTMATKNFRSFYLSDKTFGGVSMFFPKNEYKYYTNMNTRMYDYEWCREVGWKDLGW